MPAQLDKDQLTPVVEDYLKAIHALSGDGPVGTSQLARVLEVAPATVTSMTKRLADGGLLERVPYRGVALTENGREAALRLVRRHRLIELFLHKILGIPWDRIHDEAERWEHVISKDVEARIDKLLKYPTHDPHGAPIPSENLAISQTSRIPLATLHAGARGIIAEVEDADPALLRYVGGLGLYPGVVFEVLEDPPFENGPVLLRLETDSTGQHVSVDGRAAGAIGVTLT